MNSFNKMLDELQLTEKEKRYIEDEIFTFAVETLYDKRIKKTELQSCILYREIKKTWTVFMLRVFRFNWKHRIKLLCIGTRIILMNKIIKSYYNGAETKY